MGRMIVIIGLIILLAAAAAAPAYCDDALKKLGRGLCNIVTFPFELVAQPSYVNNTDGPMAASTWGVVKGIGMSVVRAAVGVYEVATFPIPFPKEYKPILTSPEFFFEKENW